MCTLGAHSLMGVGTVCTGTLSLSAEPEAQLEEQVGENEGGELGCGPAIDPELPFLSYFPFAQTPDSSSPVVNLLVKLDCLPSPLTYISTCLPNPLTWPHSGPQGPTYTRSGPCYL